MKEAVLKYLDGEFRIIKDGDYVNCAVSGKKIPLYELKYWSVDLQQAYFSAKEAKEAMHELYINDYE